MVETGFTTIGQFELRLADTGETVAQFAAPGVEGYVLGRSDTGSPYLPDIDLAAFGALQNGISRRHAALLQFNNIVHVVDLDSVNGTFINEQRLKPEKAYPLQADIIIRLGTLNLALIKIK